mmetsp:Transcript_63807/g.205603  ORF Transcript_63807/g.205603 Transcript_63807/m.205603 type:complete len:225 (+) Transcript_63807:383-1057(+)
MWPKRSASSGSSAGRQQHSRAGACNLRCIRSRIATGRCSRSPNPSSIRSCTWHSVTKSSLNWASLCKPTCRHGQWLARLWSLRSRTVKARVPSGARAVSARWAEDRSRSACGQRLRQAASNARSQRPRPESAWSWQQAWKLVGTRGPQPWPPSVARSWAAPLPQWAAALCSWPCRLPTAGRQHSWWQSCRAMSARPSSLRMPTTWCRRQWRPCLHASRASSLRS